MKVLTRTKITIDRPVQVVWDYITDPDNLPKYLVGYGLIPRAKKVEVYEGQPMTPGAKQRTTTTDGRVIEEQILQVRKNEYFDYQLISGFGFPFDLIVRTGGGAWKFVHENNTTSIEWDYYFELTSPLMYPLGALMVKFFYRNAMNAALQETKRQLDDKINLIVIDKKETPADSLMGFKKTLLQKLPIITLLTIYTLLGGIALFTYLNVSRTLLQCKQIEQEIDTFIKQASYCDVDEDCVVSQKATYPVCGCPNLINANISVSQIVKKKGEWGEKGCGQIQDLPTCVPCASVPNRAICQENRCVWKMDDSTLDTSMWQTYRNDEFGFEVKYPSNSQVNEDLQIKEFYDDIVEFLFPQKNIRVTMTAIHEIDIYDIRNPYPVAERELRHDLTIPSMHRTVINGYDTAIAELISGEEAKAYEAFIAHPRRNLYLQIIMSNSIRSDDLPWTVLYSLEMESLDEQNLSEFNQILSTFRFVEEGKPITVLSPNGGEVWKAGETYTITWTDHKVENVIITLLQGSSSSYLVGPQNGVDASLRKFDWKIDATAPYVGRSDLRVVLYDTEACDYVGLDIGGECRKDEFIHSDGSDSNFSIVE